MIRPLAEIVKRLEDVQEELRELTKYARGGDESERKIRNLLYEEERLEKRVKEYRQGKIVEMPREIPRVKKVEPVQVEEKTRQKTSICLNLNYKPKNVTNSRRMKFKKMIDNLEAKKKKNKAKMVLVVDDIDDKIHEFDSILACQSYTHISDSTIIRYFKKYENMFQINHMTFILVG